MRRGFELTRREVITKGLQSGVAIAVLTPEEAFGNAGAVRGLIAIGKKYLVPAIRFAGEVVAGWAIGRQLDELLARRNTVSPRKIIESIDALTVKCPSCTGLSHIRDLKRVRRGGQNTFIGGFECKGPNCGRRAEVKILPSEFLEGASRQLDEVRRYRETYRFSGDVYPVRGDLIAAKYSGVGLYCNTDPRNPDLRVRDLTKAEAVIFLGVKQGTHNTLHVYDPEGRAGKRYVWADARGFFRQKDGQALRVNEYSRLQGPIKTNCVDTAREQACSDY